MTLSIRIGNFLFKHVYPLYNLVYPIFKNRQDKYELELINNHVKSGDTVIDIGANIGFYTKHFAQKVGKNGKVYAFEPDSLNFKRLLANTKHLPQVIAVQAAVSNEDGILKIYKSKMLNVDHRTYPTDDAESVEEIKCIAIDNFIPESDTPSFIKIDIQGFEYSAFKGMSNTINRSSNLHIISEFWPEGMAKAGASAEKMLAFHSDHNLLPEVIINNNCVPLKAEHYLSLKGTDFLNLFLSK